MNGKKHKKLRGKSQKEMINHNLKHTAFNPLKEEKKDLIRKGKNFHNSSSKYPSRLIKKSVS